MNLRQATASRRAVAREALARYRGQVGRLLGHGENTVFAVDGADWVLRVHRDDYHSDDAILAELVLIRAAHDEGFEVPLPVAARDGSLLQTVAGHRITVLQRLPGRLQRRLGHRRARILGETLARLHAFARSWSGPALARPHWTLDAILGPEAIWGSLEFGGFDPELTVALREDLWPRLSGATEAVPLHFDLHAGNLLWNGDIPALIDWDDSGISDPIYDLAIPWCRLPPSHRSSFLDGYGTPVDPQRLAAAQLALDSRAVGWLRSRIDVPGFAERHEQFSARFTRAVRAWLTQTKAVN